MLYKKNVLTIRGSFRPVTNLNVDMIEQGKQAFFETPGVSEENTVAIAEISLNDAKGNDNHVPEEDLVQRVQVLNALGYNVMISDYTRYFSLRAYFRQYTKMEIGIVVGMINLKQIFDEESYRGVEGGILEGLGKLFADNTRMFIYPELNADGELRDSSDLKVQEHLRFLYRHLLENNFLHGLETSDPALFNTYSRDVLKKLKSGRGQWEKAVPQLAAEQIIENGFFGFKKKRK
jgi:hypothetical protein